jgi:hypothetical protein
MRWKSILVQTGSDKYVEIYHLQAYYLQAPLTAAKIVRVGDELVLMTQDSDGGNGGGCWEAYWWFDASGPHAIDFSLLVQEITKHVPPGSTFWSTCWALHLESRRLSLMFRKPMRSVALVTFWAKSRPIFISTEHSQSRAT